MIYISTKKELQDATDRKESEFIVTGDLAKKLKRFPKLMTMSKKKKTALVAFATGTGAATFAAIALSGPTFGLSIPVTYATLLASAPAAGVSIGAVIALIVVVGVIGLTAIALIKDYDVEFCNDGSNLHFKAKKNRNEEC